MSKSATVYIYIYLFTYIQIKYSMYLAFSIDVKNADLKNENR